MFSVEAAAVATGVAVIAGAVGVRRSRRRAWERRAAERLRLVQAMRVWVEQRQAETAALADAGGAAGAAAGGPESADAWGRPVSAG
ncbi:hypothetical protein [Streptacidiphilus sp. P02-A3a]|uniref:hypothetical protein n=1 Tax=Streptacidiphilus sp. P02-A3a TaxID=2704468 RepID=UPI0015FBDC55|nr:hypothetical protein [Streptacidiphilus sp. P02-A3a]QMU73200.1 hypothetical protein GXP74_38190 [Streptacidiphilus sp. P02-A3a]